MATYFGHKLAQKPDGSTAESWHGYVCGHCGREVSGAVLASIGTEERGHHERVVLWVQCTYCKKGSVVNGDTVSPSVSFGPELMGLPAEVDAAYNEARRCLGVDANTAAEGLCRKLLMHVAVDKGAKEGATFAAYIDFLEQAGYVTPPMKPWVALIRKYGNESQHALPPSDRKRAEGTLLFTAQLLRSVYEMGHIAAQFLATPAP